MSILDQVTIEQFKGYFHRDFPFLPLYDDLLTYWKDDVVFYENNFYKSLVDDNVGNDVTDTAYWRKIKGDTNDYVTDMDIEKAMSQAIISGNVNFGETCAEKINIYLHLVAFYLVVDLKNAASGAYGSYVGMTQSKSVGDVSESYAVPTWLQQTPMYSLFSQNGYGVKYLTLIAPYLAVTILFSRGRTTYG